VKRTQILASLLASVSLIAAAIAITETLSCSPRGEALRGHPERIPLPREESNGFVPSISSRDLPNDCAIIATEAAARLMRAGVWVKILNIAYVDLETRSIVRHDLTVWQPPAAKQINVYDLSILKGTAELETESHDAKQISAALAKRNDVAIADAYFLK
jgi:hypothetical protein